MQRLTTCCFFLLLFLSGIQRASVCFAQNDMDSSKKEKNISLAGIILPSRSPENGFYAQGGLIGLFKTDPKDSLLRASNLYLFGLYSQLHQYRISTGGDLFTKREKYYLNGWYYYSYLPELYFGTGNQVSSQQSEFINYRLWYMNTNVLRNIYQKWFAGVSYTYEHLYQMNIPAGGLAASDVLPGMRTNTLSGPGIKIRHDSRDNILSTNKGFFLDMSYSFFRTGLGSSYQFDQFGLDIRKFINLTPKKYNILAFNFLLRHSAGNVPFRYLSNITARGYHPNLYRNNSLISLQAEYRLRIWNWIGASFFGGLSEIAGTPDQLSFNSIRENYGGGLRFRVIKKHNMYLRIEYGRGRNNSNYYVSFYDAF